MCTATGHIRAVLIGIFYLLLLLRLRCLLLHQSQISQIRAEQQRGEALANDGGQRTVTGCCVWRAIIATDDSVTHLACPFLHSSHSCCTLKEQVQFTPSVCVDYPLLLLFLLLHGTILIELCARWRFLLGSAQEAGQQLQLPSAKWRHFPFLLLP